MKEDGIHFFCFKIYQQVIWFTNPSKMQISFIKSIVQQGPNFCTPVAYIILSYCKRLCTEQGSAKSPQILVTLSHQ